MFSQVFVLRKCLIDFACGKLGNPGSYLKEPGENDFPDFSIVAPSKLVAQSIEASPLGLCHMKRHMF